MPLTKLAIHSNDTSSPFLKPEHFGYMSLQMDDKGGLAFSMGVTDDDIDELVYVANAAQADKPIPSIGDSVECFLNPAELPLSQLRAITGAADADAKDGGGFEWDYSLPTETYDPSWTVWRTDAEEHSEGQSLVLVCKTSSGDLAGHAVIAPSACFYTELKEVGLRCGLELIYVLPAQRGRGYGLALAAAISALLVDLMQAIRAAAPKDWSVDVTIHSDFASSGGERTADYVQAMLEANVPRITRHLKGTKLKVTRMDAGF